MPVILRNWRTPPAQPVIPDAGSGYGIDSYGNGQWDETPIDHGYSATTNMAMPKMIYGQVGWGGKLNEDFDKIDALEARITALENP